MISILRKIKLKKFLRKSGIFNKHIYIIIAFLVVWVVTIGYFNLNSSNIKLHLVNSANEINMQSHYINSLLNPKTIEPGQPNSTLNTIDAEISDRRLRMPHLPTKLSILAIRPLDSTFKQSVENLPDLQALDTETNELLTHHILVLNACKSLLTYNPVYDLSSKELTQEELDFRINGAKEGLGSTKKKIKEINAYSQNDDLDELYKYIDALEKDLDIFDRTRDKTFWFNAVNKAQRQVIANRENFWAAEKNILLTKYAIAQQNIHIMANNL